MLAVNFKYAFRALSLPPGRGWTGLEVGGKRERTRVRMGWVWSVQSRGCLSPQWQLCLPILELKLWILSFRDGVTLLPWQPVQIRARLHAGRRSRLRGASFLEIRKVKAFVAASHLPWGFLSLTRQWPWEWAKPRWPQQAWGERGLRVFVSIRKNLCPLPH